MRKIKAPGIDTYRGKLRYRFKLPGRPRIEVVTGLEAERRNLDTAKRLRDEHKSRILLGEPEPIAAVPFNEAADRFLAWKRAKHRDKPNTARRVGVSLESWRFFMGGRTIDTMNTGDVLTYMTWRRERNIAEVTLRKDVLAGRQVARFAMQHRWLDTDPFIGIEVPSDADSRVELVLNDAEAAAYLAEASKHHALGDVAGLILEQGLRPDCEVLQIEKSHVDFNRRELYIPRSKSRASERTLRLTDDSMRILGRRMAGAGPLVFPGVRRDGPLSYSGLINVHNRAVVRSGVQRFTMYSLRHTFATRFYDSTSNLLALADILGHADLKTVRRYVNENQRRMDEAMERFAAARAREDKAIWAN